MSQWLMQPPAAVCKATAVNYIIMYYNFCALMAKNGMPLSGCAMLMLNLIGNDR